MDTVIREGLENRTGYEASLGVADQVNALWMFFAYSQNIVSNLLHLMPGIL